MKKSILIIASVLFLSFSSKAQILINGGLEGVASIDIAPNGWEVVPYTDVNCEATDWYGATPDITTANGPVAANGLNGNPHGGLSFISGLYCGEGESVSHQEGIMQTVSGFAVGGEYTISFWQTIIKQQNLDCLDTTGSWGVYLDNNLIAFVPMSHSLLPPISLNHIWDYRQVSFHATATTHTIKFLPADDDLDRSISTSDLGAALRMGIDDVQLTRKGELGITTLTEEHITVSPSPTKGDFSIQVKNGIQVRSVRITDYLGHLVEYRTFNSTESGMIQMNLEGKSGIYFVVVTCEDGKEFAARIQKL